MTLLAADYADSFERALAEIAAVYRPLVSDPAARISAIRSDTLMDHISAAAERELVARGVPPFALHRKHDALMPGKYGPKRQDIAVQIDGEYVISINIKSQLSSIMKNLDGRITELAGEAANLHGADPRLVCGSLYVLPTQGFPAEPGRPAESLNWAKILDRFNTLAERDEPSDSTDGYEAVGLLAVDFEQEPPYVLRDRHDFATLVPEQVLDGIDVARISIDAFFDDLVGISRARYGW